MITDRRIGLMHLLREGVPSLLMLFAWDVAVVLIFKFAHRSWMDHPFLSMTLLGSVLVLFLSIRNNAAYSRWWEARTLWGSIVNNVRSFSRQTASLLDGAPELTRAMAAYAHALRGALRGVDATADIERLAGAELLERVRGRQNLPNAILYEIGLAVRRVVRQRTVHASAHAAIDGILSDLSNAQGGLERIRNTPLAIQFSAFPGVVVRIVCLLLPLSMVEELGWITPFGSTLVGFLFIALDRIGADLENPFVDGVHALPMQAIVRTIEIDLLQSIGDAAPPPLTAVRGVLP